jgi:hypothetical protein
MIAQYLTVIKYKHHVIKALQHKSDKYSPVTSILILSVIEDRLIWQKHNISDITITQMFLNQN